jgi:hypothetical protein
MWKFVCLSKEADPLLYEVESWNLADLSEGLPKQKGKSEIKKKKIAPVDPKWGMEVQCSSIY